MPESHAWPGKPHDFSDLLPLLAFVTVNGATCAGWFFIAVGTFFKPLFGIAQQVCATGTGFAVIRGMMMGTIDLCHALQCCMFALQPAG
jgi:hypothetical protein